MLRFGDLKVAKEELMAQKKTIKTWYFDVDNLVISK